MRKRITNKTELEDVLRLNGYTLERISAHRIWKKGNDTIVVPQREPDRRGLLNLISVLRRHGIEG